MLLRQRWPGRPGTGSAGAEGAQERRKCVDRTRPTRGIRQRLPVSADQERSGVRGQVPAGHLGGASVDRQAPGGCGAPGRRGRHRARRHRQGQRPGALRTDRDGARSAAEDHRPLARVGNPFKGRRHCLRRQPQCAGDRHYQVHLQPRRQPVAPLA